MRKVNLDVLRDWVVKKVTQLVGFEDEVVIEYALGLMEDKSQPVSVLIILLFLYGQYVQYILESRPSFDANQPYRFPHKEYCHVHDRTVEASA